MNTLNILLVDDDRSLVTTLSEGLSKAMEEVVTISVCFNGPEALSKLALQQFDLVISDYHLPGMTGLELLNAIRQTHDKTHLILITAFGSDELENETFCRAIGYMTKPFELPLLVQLIKSHLCNKPLSGEAVTLPHTDGKNASPGPLASGSSLNRGDRIHDREQA